MTTLQVYLKIASHVLNDEQKLDFEKSLCGCVGQIALKLKESVPDCCDQSTDTFVKVLAVCHVLTELNDLTRLCLSETQALLDKRESPKKGEVSGSALDSLSATLSSSAPRVVNRAYQESLRKENPKNDSYSSESLERGAILKVKIDVK